MATFSARSLEALGTAHPRLQELAHAAIAGRDFAVLVGHRGEAAQNAAYDAGRSRVRWPDGKHNKLPSLAIDVCPHPRPEPGSKHEVRHYDLLAGYLLGVAQQLGIALRWGGDWDRDGDPTDQRFHDLGHFELVMD